MTDDTRAYLITSTHHHATIHFPGQGFYLQMEDHDHGSKIRKKEYSNTKLCLGKDLVNYLDLQNKCREADSEENQKDFNTFSIRRLYNDELEDAISVSSMLWVQENIESLLTKK